MGIELNVAGAIVREHAWRAITGTVLLLGRQTMHFTPEAAVDLVRSAKLPLPDGPIEIDRQTLRSIDGNFIRDDEFFRLLGVPSVLVLDHSAFEGANLIHDLNRPVPDKLVEIADFIVDGSTLDNVWDAAMTLRNINKMLKSGGRLVSINMGSNHYTPYTIISPQWILDYFVVNDFADCKVYTFVYGDSGLSVFTPDPQWVLHSGDQALNNFASNSVMGVVVLAEKGPNSTIDRVPDQQHYRSAEDMLTYQEKFQRMLSTGRPHPARSPSSAGLATAQITQRTGWLYVNEQGLCG
jgi:hypothetical protein